MQRAAEAIESNKEDIIDIWVKRVRKELSAPNETSDPVLRDHLSLILDDILKIMKRYDNFEILSEIGNYDGMLDNSIGHGRHRSSSSGYDMEQVLREYIILHRILTEKLRLEKVYSTEVGDLLKYIIENSMLYSVVAFTKSIQKMRQKLLGVLAHDLRNPISAAHLGLGMIRQEDAPERFEKVRNMSRNSIKRSLDLLEDLLESVTVEAGEGIILHFSERDLVEYIEAVQGDSSEIYSNEIILKCEEEKIIGVFDCAMISRVLENIINNAVKYGERGSPVTIKIEDFPEEVRISIHNRGKPIPRNDQKKIFQFLNTTSGSRPGELRSWGMGLSIVKAVVKAHGGTVDLESNEENGTTFTLVLGKKANEPGKVTTTLNFAGNN